MDAVKFLVECHNYCADCRAKVGKDWSTENCFLCDLNYHIGSFKQESAERMVKIVERLIEEKKGKTRQGRFLKVFPNATNVLDFCPHAMDATFRNRCDGASPEFCRRCKKDYWLTPIEETTNKETN